MADPQAGDAAGENADPNATAGTGAADTAGAARMKSRANQVQEVADELAQETKRTTLLDRVETQLKGQTHCARLLFGFSIVDDRKTPADLEAQFKEWRKKQDNNADDLTGILLFTVQVGIHFLEGPPELLFGALAFFNALAAEPAAPASPVAGPSTSIGPVRVLHFTELHGVRTSASWCCYVHPGKASGAAQTQVEDSNCAEMVMQCYRKFLLLSLKAKETYDGRDAKNGYRRAQDLLPTVDEVNALLGKNAAEYFFNYAEFHKLFVAPFNLVLHSELLWPMPPALSY